MTPFDDVGEVILEFGDIYTPDAADDAAASMAEGSDIHSVDGSSATAEVRHDIAAVVLAYLLDLDVPPAKAPNLAQPSPSEQAGVEPRKEP